MNDLMAEGGEDSVVVMVISFYNPVVMIDLTDTASSTHHGHIMDAGNR